jgi:hypothetical protein
VEATEPDLQTLSVTTPENFVRKQSTQIIGWRLQKRTVGADKGKKDSTNSLRWT